MEGSHTQVEWNEGRSKTYEHNIIPYLVVSVLGLLILSGFFVC
jgi:hypothetical protein